MGSLSSTMRLKCLHPKEITSQKKVRRKMKIWKKFSLRKSRQVSTCSKLTPTTVSYSECQLLSTLSTPLTSATWKLWQEPKLNLSMGNSFTIGTKMLPKYSLSPTNLMSKFRRELTVPIRRPRLSKTWGLELSYNRSLSRQWNPALSSARYSWKKSKAGSYFSTNQ